MFRGYPFKARKEAILFRDGQKEEQNLQQIGKFFPSPILPRVKLSKKIVDAEYM